MVEIVTRRRLSGTLGQNDENKDCHTQINAVVRYEHHTHANTSCTTL